MSEGGVTASIESGMSVGKDSMFDFIVFCYCDGPEVDGVCVC